MGNVDARGRREWGELPSCLRSWAHFHKRQKQLLTMGKCKVSSMITQLFRRNGSLRTTLVAKMEDPENPTLMQQI